MKKYALISAPVAPLLLEPREQAELADEALHGMKVELLEEAGGGWLRVRTPYHYEGYVQNNLLMDREELLQKWEALPKLTVWQAEADVLSAPGYRSWRLECLPRGATVAALGPADENGWGKVFLCDGREGTMKSGFLREQAACWSKQDETYLRNKLVDTAMSYLGVQYRWGGKTPRGIDCSGLCSMAYLLNGIVIFRDADIREGFCMKAIPAESARRGDLVFFKGHVAMAMGEGKIIHSTARNGSDGVVVNSLNPMDGDFRPDLPGIIRFAGTIF